MAGIDADLYVGIPIFLFVYIAFFALAQGAVIWVFISEVFPSIIRAQGQSMGSSTHWLLAAIVANVFPFSPILMAGACISLFHVDDGDLDIVGLESNAGNPGHFSGRPGDTIVPIPLESEMINLMNYSHQNDLFFRLHPSEG